MKIFKRDKMGPEGAHFADRWMLDFGAFSIRLHRWYASDDPEAFHDHPGWFVTLVLWGGYDDISPAGRWERVDKLRFGSIRFRRAEYMHSVQNKAKNTWTLCLFGRPVRRWAFLDTFGKRRNRDKYFAEVGHHTADGLRIRLRPDGSRIG